MTSVLLSLSGVLQSWGTTTIGHARATNGYPTKSAIVGMVANALGRDREDDISDISSVGFAVRVDMPGVVQRDYHTVSILKQPTKGDRISRVTERFYLADAAFLVVLSHPDRVMMDDIARSLKSPSRALFLGRKSCSPTRPIFHSVSESELSSVLSETEWLADEKTQREYLDEFIELDVFRDPLTDIEGFESDVISDEPVSFSSDARRYASRGVYRSTVRISLGAKTVPSQSMTNPLQLAFEAAGGKA